MRTHTPTPTRLRAVRSMRRQPNQRRGAALVLAVALMFILFSFLAFSIDTGYLAQSRAEMRRSADAAAMAGCWELYSQMEKGKTAEQSHSQIRQTAANLAALNPICRSGPQLDSSSVSQDIQIGYLSDTRNGQISSDSSRPYYAVRTIVNRTADQNGEIPYFFGRIFGDVGRPMTTEATAIMAKQISGFNEPPTSADTLNLLPFALDLQTWQSLLAGAATDKYAYNSANGSVTNGSDGILEVNLYPQGTGSPGNRGTVDIGGANNSTNDIARQIVHGISKQDMQALGKPLQLTAGSNFKLNGDTGISAGVKDELASIIGQKRIIPIFSSVSGNGNNANYTIVKWVGVRILNVKLTGKMSDKQLIVQPAPVISPYGVLSQGSGYSDFVLSPVLLAR